MSEKVSSFLNAAESEGRSGLSALDQLVVNAVVDSKREVVGALSAGALALAVEEFVDLNGRRPQSQFVLGYRDALFGRPLAKALRTQERQSVRWYWAGVVDGLARRNAWSRIVNLHGEHSTVRELGDGADAASWRAGPHIARSLWENGRGVELTQFVGLFLAGHPEVNELLLEAGTDALRRWNPGEALGLLELLSRYADTVDPSDLLLENLPTVRRRMAHCLRLLGEHESARNLLESLLETAGDSGVRAMVQADLGLMAGRFNLLSDIRIHGDAGALQELVDRLRSGEHYFESAVENSEVPYASHGYFCLGVLALADVNADDAEERFKKADRCLEHARAYFSRSPNYPRLLIARTDLYLGIAKSQVIEAGEIRHAADLIAAGLGEADFPVHFVAKVMESLDLDESGESLGVIVEPLLALEDDEILNALAETRIAQTHPRLRERLRERACRGDLSPSLAAADLRRVLPGYLKARDRDTALHVLDELESLALEQHSGLSEFAALLEHPDKYAPAWEPEDAAIARARCLTLEGRGIDAFEVLRVVFRDLMQRGETTGAGEVLERMRSCEVDLEVAGYADLSEWYGRQAKEDESLASKEDAGEPVSVLVVGGNEVQDRFNERVSSKVAGKDRRVSLQFLRTGWGANWNSYVDDVRRRLPNFDAVVILRFIRTGLGKHVRAMCGEHNVPWRFCYAGGQDAQARAVLEAVEAARAQQ